jgi:integrase
VSRQRYLEKMVFLPDKRYYYTKDELQRLFRVIRKGNPREYVLFKTLALTGRRVSEVVGFPKRGIIGLRPVDIDWNARLVTWTLEKRGKWEKSVDPTTGKNRRKLIERDIEKLQVSEEILNQLREYIEAKKIGEYDRVFPISIQYVNQILRKYIKEAEIAEKKHIVHALRHTFALQSLPHMKTSEDLRKLQKELGHTSMTTTEQYFKYKEINERELLEKVAKELDI